MGAPKKADWREERRKRAWELKQAGWKQQDIAEALGVTEGAVSQWMKSGREGGEDALKAHPAKGATPRLTAEQQAQIPAVLAKGASAYGFRGEVWNSRRLAVAIKREFGVSSHPDHCGYWCGRWATACRNRWTGPPNAMSKPSSTGKRATSHG